MPYRPIQLRLTAPQIAGAQRAGAAFAKVIHAARQEAGPGALVLAWVSDIHLHAWRDYPHDLSLYGKWVDSSANLRLALTEIVQVQPDLLVFGGDVADSGAGGEGPLDEYAEFKCITDELLPKSAASLLVLGNHDHGDRPLSNEYVQGLKTLARADWPQPVDNADYYYVAVRGGWRFITLDSRQRQAFSEKQLNWLASELEKDAATPTAILVHRPFVSVGNWVDNHRIIERRVFDLVDHAACVKAVFSGHTHKARAWQYRKKLHTVFPSVAYAIDDACGWGCVVLGKDRVAAVFAKDLAGEYFEHVRYQLIQQAGEIRPLPLALYEDSPLCDPCTLPRRNDKRSRD